jgi:CheY-like chemotaxis protein
MMFQALLVSKDEQAQRILRPVFTGFGVQVQLCGYPDAVVRLTEQKFDAVVVDFDDPHSATLVLQNAASNGSKAVTLALLSDQTKVRNVFGAGANFVVYKPISEPQAQATLRAAMAVIKRERRRSFRVPVQVPAQLRVKNGPEMEGILLDLSEEGMDILAVQALCPSAVVSANFTLPGGTTLQLSGEVAWANPNGQCGVRLVGISEKTRGALRTWVAANATELPPDDSSVEEQCRLSDLSPGACYVETDAPFPEHSGVSLILRAGQTEAQVDGVVRVMHPGVGMGIEFCSATEEHRRRVERLIEVLTQNPGSAPRLAVTPCGLGNIEEPGMQQDSGPEDQLLDLLRRRDAFTQEQFLQELRKQRHSEAVSS